MRHTWEDEGDQVLQLNHLLPLTFPSRTVTGLVLSGRGKTKHCSRLGHQYVNASFGQVPQAFAGAAPAFQAREAQKCDVPKNSP